MSNETVVAARYRGVSFSRVLAITVNTLTELTRLKVFYVLLVFALLLIGSSTFMAQFSFQQEFQILKDVSLGAISIFTSLLAIVATARLLPQDLEDRTVYTILAKPVPRFEYVLGKIAGVLLLLAISTLVMSAAFLAMLYLREQAVIHATLRQMTGAPPEQIADALRAIRSSALNIDIFPGIIIIYLKACLLAALTLFVSTFATTNICRPLRVNIGSRNTVADCLPGSFSQSSPCCFRTCRRSTWSMISSPVRPFHWRSSQRRQRLAFSIRRSTRCWRRSCSTGKNYDSGSCRAGDFGCARRAQIAD